MSIADELQKLQQLRASGAINDEEFSQAKARVLNGSPAAGPFAAGRVAAAADDPETREKETRLWAMLLHLSILAGWAVPLGGLIVPIVIWQLKKTDLPGIDVHGKNAANWIISHLIYVMVSLILCFVVIGIPLFFAVVVVSLVFPIIAALKANEGEVWRYPLSIAFFNCSGDQVQASSPPVHSFSLGDRTMSDDASNPEVLVRVATEVEAALIVAALAAQGIKAEAVGGAIAGFRAEVPADVAVVVQAGHLEEAKRALSEIREQLSDVDWSNVDVGTPE